MKKNINKLWKLSGSVMLFMLFFGMAFGQMTMTETFDWPGPPTNHPSTGSVAYDLDAVVDPCGDGTPATILDVNMPISIFHTFAGDLEIDLTHNGTTVRLYDNSCGSLNNVIGIFDDEGAAFTCPMNGVEQPPANPLSAFDGMDPNGTWTMTLNDVCCFEVATINSWAVEIEYEFACATGGFCQLVCPGDMIINLQPFECTRVVNYDVHLIGNACGPDERQMACNVTHNADLTIIQDALDFFGKPVGQFRAFDLDGQFGKTGDFTVTDVNVGHWNGGGSIDINLYTTNTPYVPGVAPQYANMTLVHSDVAVPVPAGFQFYNVYPLSAPVTFAPTDDVVLEIVSRVGNPLFTVGANYQGQTDDGYITFPAGTGFIQSYASLGFGFIHVAMELIGTETEAGSQVTQVEGIPSGEEYPIGETCNKFYYVDPNDVVLDSCEFCVTVNEFADPTDATCNDNVQVSLDSLCEALVTPDDILEGSYGCTDSIEVIVHDGPDSSYPPIPTSPVVTGDYKGQTLAVTVILRNGNSCWGTISIEDKLPPILECVDATIECTESITPSNVSSCVDTLTFDGALGGGGWVECTTVGASGPGNDYTVDVDLPDGAIINDFTLTMDLSHTWIGDVSGQLTAPNGTVVTLFSRPGLGGLVFTPCGTCCGFAADNIIASFNDNAPNTAANFEGNTPAVNGGDSYNAFTSLAPTYANDDADGTWTLTLYDGFAGDAGTLNSWDLTFAIQLAGPNTYPGGNPALLQPCVTDNCGMFDLTYTDEELFDTCNVAGTIERTWIATDMSGNSATCLQTITVTLNDRPAIRWPDDLVTDCIEHVDALDPDDILNRGDFGSSNPASNRYAYPRETPFTNDYCGQLAYNHTDQVFDVCQPYGFKIRRTWEVLDWCDPNFSDSHIQLIKVQDTVPPTANTPGDITLSTGSTVCTAPLPNGTPTGLSDNCDAAPVRLPFSANLLGSYYEDEDGNKFATSVVGPGVYYVVYVISDACGNKREIRQLVTVVDGIPPIAICDQNTNLSLTSDGWAEICWTTIDDGSYDICDPDPMIQIRRPDQVPPNGLTPNDPLYETTWSDCVIFRCVDIGEDRVVEMRVKDASGNENKCWAYIDIEDKLPPAILCPPDITIGCDVDYNDLSVTGDVDARSQYSPPSNPLNGVAWGGCSAPEITHTDLGFNGCTGTITRVWRATKTITTHNGDLDVYVECHQLITVVDLTPADVIFPDDITVDCTIDNTEPQYTGYPELIYDCENLGVSQTDEEFDICLPYGYKIKRTWHVIDWCDPSFDETHDQIIKVEDLVAPELDVTVQVQPMGNDCGAEVIITATATDNCANPSHIYITNDSWYSTAGDLADASGFYPKGEYTFTFTATDPCGNFVTEDVTVRVRDTKKPTPVCLTIAVDMKSTGQVEVTSDMLDGGSYDNCADQQNLKFMIQRVDADDNELADPEPSVIFGCDDVWTVQYVRLWVFDGPIGAPGVNSDYCITTVYVQDNNGYCGNGTLAGTIQTTDGQDIDEVDVFC